ncbi:MAG: L-seryl-tRNA(Sec) selenium transferase [Pseudomonadota bacterium]
MPELRDLPAVDTVLSHPDLSTLCARHGLQTVRDRVRAVQNDIRRAGAVPGWAVDPSAYAGVLANALMPKGYRPVFNLTGTVIHTNLGRALLSRELWQDIEPLVTRPMNLEYDLVAGSRGDRDAVIEERLARLVGCEAATVVNNNAAALLLVLNSLALGRKVPVSRGELIEIGGSFRLPELMARSGCTLLEVGTTNRTHLKDYAAVAPEAALLLKVHPSNYHISGFTKEVSAQELSGLAREHDIPSCVDLGAGTLVDLTRWGLPYEPTPDAMLGQGIDVVTFSGDKLLGGVQAGIIVGNKTHLDAIKQNPMKRALRADKITLAILDATLKLYENPERLPTALPLLNALTASGEEMCRRGQAVIAALPAGWAGHVIESSGQIGSGALPDQTIDSIAVTLDHPEYSAQRIQTLLRELPTPVIGRIKESRVLLDMRMASPLDELTDVLAALPA